MNGSWMVALAACIALAGSATVAGAGLLSAKGAVIAILAEELFVGEAEGHLDGSGTLAIRSQRGPAVSCIGQFTSSAERGGSGQLHCSDGTTGTFHFERLTLTRGHGAGTVGGGPMSFVYGLTAGESTPYLKLPGGKRLGRDGTQLALVDL